MIINYFADPAERKEESNITPRPDLHDGLGFGQVLLLDKKMHKLLQAGLLGYDQLQVSSNSGTQSSGIPASATPYYSAHALGFQVNFIAPEKNIILFFKFEEDFRAKARVEGRTFVLGANYTLRIPKAKPHS